MKPKKLCLLLAQSQEKRYLLDRWKIRARYHISNCLISGGGGHLPRESQVLVNRPRACSTDQIVPLTKRKPQVRALHGSPSPCSPQQILPHSRRSPPHSPPLDPEASSKLTSSSLTSVKHAVTSLDNPEPSFTATNSPCSAPQPQALRICPSWPQDPQHRSTWSPILRLDPSHL